MNNKIGYRSLLWATGLTTFAACGAHAQETQGNILETVVVTMDRQEGVVQDVPASISVVGPETLNSFRAVHIGEILNTVPGVVFNRGNGQESLMGIRSPVLTGAGSCGAFQIAQDGIPLRGVGFCNVNELFEANTEQASDIEIVRGPGSVLFGVNALHGAINVISPSLSMKTGGSVSLDAGPHSYGRLEFGYDGEAGDQGRFGVHFNDASDGGYKNDSGFKQQKINVGYRYDGGKTRITTVFAATNLDQETAGYLEGFEAYKVDALKKVNPNPDAYRNAHGERVFTRIERDMAGGTLMLTPYYRNTDMDFLMHFLPGTPVEENGHESIGMQSMYTFDTSESMNWKVGLDLESTDGYLRQTQSGGFGPFPAGKQYDYDVTARMWSPYALMKLQMSDQNQLSVGLRYQYLKYDYNNLMIDGNTAEDGTPCPGGCRYSRPADRTDSFDNLTAQVGWIHDLDANSQFYANVSYAFRAPEATELYRLQANQTVSDLSSEHIKSIEAGYRASRSRISYTLAAYYMLKDNVIFQDSDRNNVSGGKTKHRGIELNTIVSMTDRLTLDVVASFARHTYESNIAPLGVTVLLDGKDMDTAPRVVGNVRLNWDVNPANSINFEWVHMGPYYTDESNEHRYAGHDLMNVRYRYDAGNDWFFSARVTNLFDVDYAERADYSGFGGDRYFVGEPVSLYLTIGRSF